MEDRHRKILKRKYKDLSRDLRPDEVMDYLLQEDIFEFNDLELIRAEKTTKQQVEKLLSILVTCGPRAFPVFLESLKERYSWLYDDLKKADDESRGQSQQPEPGYDDGTSTSEARSPLQETAGPSPDPTGTSLKRPLEPATQTREKAAVQGAAGGPLTDEEKVARGMEKMKLIEHVERIEIPPEIAKKRVTEKQLNTLAGKLGKKWENLAIDLDLTSADVDRFKADHPHNMRSQVFAMLITWRAKNGSAATVGTLVRNLEDFGFDFESFAFLLQTK